MFFHQSSNIKIFMVVRMINQNNFLFQGIIFKSIEVIKKIQLSSQKITQLQARNS